VLSAELSRAALPVKVWVPMWLRMHIVGTYVCGRGCVCTPVCGVCVCENQPPPLGSWKVPASFVTLGNIQNSSLFQGILLCVVGQREAEGRTGLPVKFLWEQQVEGRHESRLMHCTLVAASIGSEVG
jgi:hypothetical protein